MQGYGPVLLAGAEMITMLRTFDMDATLNTFHYRPKGAGEDAGRTAHEGARVRASDRDRRGGRDVRRRPHRPRPAPQSGDRVVTVSESSGGRAARRNDRSVRRCAAPRAGVRRCPPRSRPGRPGRARPADAGRGYGRQRHVRVRHLPGRSGGVGAPHVHAHGRGAPRRHSRRVPRLRPVRAGAAGRLRLGERPGRPPHVRRGAGNLAAGAVDEQRGGCLGRRTLRAWWRTTGT